MFIKVKFTKRALSLFLILLIAGTANSQELLKRKNIDSLTKQELAAYKHAIQILHDRSMVNPYDEEGYAWQAWIHNATYISIPQTPPRTKKPGETYADYYNYIAGLRFKDGKGVYPGMCEHRKDLFMLWHRAEFYYFEKILQNADPAGTIKDSKGNMGPSTAKVTVPYWNFTNPASGKRFPKAFEDPASVLYRGNRRVGNPDYPFTKKALLQDIIDGKWLVFGGFPNATGGQISGGYGRFEAEIHDDMHDTYCGGDMSSPKTAAYDPIFYSFHSYVDFYLDEWLRLNHMEEHGYNTNDTITSLGFPLRGTVPTEYDLPDYHRKPGVDMGMGSGSLYPNHVTLGYGYEVAPEDHYAPRDRAKEAQPVFGKDAVSLKSTLTKGTSLVAKNKEGIKQTLGTLKGNTRVHNGFLDVESSITTSYRVDVYIHPKTVNATITDQKFRDRYLANSANYWVMGDASMTDAATHVNIYIAREQDDINNNSNPNDWTVTTNITKL